MKLLRRSAGASGRQLMPRRQSSSSPDRLSLAFGMLFVLTLMLLVLLALKIFSLPFGCESPGAEQSSPVDRRVEVAEKKEEEEEKRTQMEVLSWQPRIFLYQGFLRADECEHLIELAKPHMARSTVVDNEKGNGMLSNVRTSSGMFMRRGQDGTIRAIEERIAGVTFVPAGHGEGLQVLHYEVGQKYDPHPDFFSDSFNTNNGGQRAATVLMYLSDVEEGGETVFPLVKANGSASRYGGRLSQCASEGLAVKPKKGDAVLFWSLTPDGREDIKTTHGSCPVIKGDKWSCTKWIRVREYN